MEKSTPADACWSWDPGIDGLTEVFHARFTEHAYPVHCHDTWTVLLIDRGTVRYDLHRHERAASPAHVTVLPPHVAHDGQSASSSAGFEKRVLYVETTQISERLVGAAVDRSTLPDPELRLAIARLHETFREPAVTLEQTSLLAMIAERITELLAGSATRLPESSDAAEALRAAIDDDPTSAASLEEFAQELGWSATHLVRSFTSQFGLPPHRYLLSRRIDRARRLLAAGMPPAIVAAELGFHDQAHLGRHFKTHVGTPPGRYQAQSR